MRKEKTLWKDGSFLTGIARTRSLQNLPWTLKTCVWLLLHACWLCCSDSADSEERQDQSSPFGPIRCWREDWEKSSSFNEHLSLKSERGQKCYLVLILRFILCSCADGDICSLNKKTSCLFTYFYLFLIVCYCLKKWISASMSSIVQHIKSLWLALGKLILWHSLVMPFPLCKFVIFFSCTFFIICWTVVLLSFNELRQFSWVWPSSQYAACM